MTWLSIEIARKGYDSKPKVKLSAAIGLPKLKDAESDQKATVLKDIKLEVGFGEFVCILGPSGCGKTTLLNLVAGLDGTFDGRISVRQTNGRSEPRIGYVFQNPALLPWRTVGENLTLVMRPDQLGTGVERDLLAEMGLGDCYDAYPKDLSLGMSRRVALARALVIEPDLLLMDEPFVSLDESKASELRRLLTRAWKSRPMTVLFVTHDSREAIQLGQRIIVMAGSPATIQRDDMVMLTHDQRIDPLYIEAVRRQILSETRPRL
ncbi:ABC transporter ATP-binding protein [Pelagibius sp. Alg239-R121]|uniref:ABC transporter ATP-binding protein n=1 Tax=Pelagibius sp. Alg239-R121 TaxID=2993448 RepID=UPI0024A754E4|nr:ABC transporter ATP-binding protein [Pelagibius sp. Alg239-R121]